MKPDRRATSSALCVAGVSGGICCGFSVISKGPLDGDWYVLAAEESNSLDDDKCEELIGSLTEN
jgi:hypothetical protein